MLRRIIFVLFLIPLAIILIALTVANRMPVPLNLDVFNPSNPAVSFTAPLFVWLYGAALIGVVVGGIGSWFAQGKHRKRERQYRKESQKLRFEMEETKKQAAPDASTSTSLVLSR